MKITSFALALATTRKPIPTPYIPKKSTTTGANGNFRLGSLAIVFCISIGPAACSRRNPPESPAPTITPTPALSLELPRPKRKSAPKSASLGSSIAGADQVKAKAETGDAAAEYDLGMRYVRGDGVPKDYPEAVKWLRKAADQDYADGQRQLGNAYFNGKGVEKDYDQAFAWYSKAAKQGNIEAQATLGVCYEFGRGVTQDYWQAGEWYRKAAKLNNALAQNNLGNAYIQGRGVTKDVVQGYKWILLAAAQGHLLAQKNVTTFESKLTSAQLAMARALADAFRAGDLSGPTTLPPLPTPSLPGRPAESSSLGSSSAAADQVKAKAEAGDAAAEYNLGMRYARGAGVPKDYSEAVKWFRKAADQDHADAQRQLGNAYSSGQGVEKDYDQAFAWYSKAAGQGNVDAEASLGVYYEFGHGVAQNYCEANGWYHKAAELNNALAQNNLGNAYIRGQCVTKDAVQGYKWILLAAAQGEPSAQKNVIKIESGLTSSQLAQGKALAEAFRAGDLSGPTTLPPLPTPSLARSIADNGTPKPSPNSDPKNPLGLAPLPTVPPAPHPSVEGTLTGTRDRAEAGDAEAQCQLGLCYLAGNGVPKSLPEGARWLSKAAEQNNALAEFNLGVCYSKGLGLRKNQAEGYKWYLKAAEQNNSEAEFNLGNCYLNGEGVRKNAAEAYKWFYKGAQQNDGDAQSNLGYCYMNGVGVRRDDVQAYKWYALGAAKGNDEAKGGLAILESRMPRSAIAQGKALVREFAPGEGAGPEGGSQGVPAEERSSQSQNGPLKPHNTGTGFFVTDDGYMITNFHVVKDGAAVQLLTGHGKISARVVQVDSTNDLALLKAEGVFVALPLESSVGIKLGDTVSTVGFPFPDLQGVKPKFTRGEISSLAGPKDDERFFQISTQIQPGNSGGALVNEHGNVVGVTSAQLSASYVFKTKGNIPENVNYAIKSNLVLSFLRSALNTPDKLKSPIADENKPPDLIDRMEQAAAMVVVYWHTEK